MLYQVGDSRHTQNIQINKVIGEMKNVGYFFIEKTKWTFWPVQYIFWIFWGTSILFSRVTAPIYISTTSVQGSLFSTFSLPLVTSCLIDGSHSIRQEVISHCGFPCIFLTASEADHLFMYLVAICICSWEKKTLLCSGPLVECFRKCAGKASRKILRWGLDEGPLRYEVSVVV